MADIYKPLLAVTLKHIEHGRELERQIGYLAQTMREVLDALDRHNATAADLTEAFKNLRS